LGFHVTSGWDGRRCSRYISFETFWLFLVYCHFLLNLCDFASHRCLFFLFPSRFKLWKLLWTFPFLFQFIFFFYRFPRVYWITFFLFRAWLITEPARLWAHDIFAFLGFNLIIFNIFNLKFILNISLSIFFSFYIK
jgi:hypothetical protein